MFCFVSIANILMSLSQWCFTPEWFFSNCNSATVYKIAVLLGFFFSLAPDAQRLRINKPLGLAFYLSELILVNKTLISTVLSKDSIQKSIHHGTLETGLKEHANDIECVWMQHLALIYLLPHKVVQKLMLKRCDTLN